MHPFVFGPPAARLERITKIVGKTRSNSQFPVKIAAAGGKKNRDRLRDRPGDRPNLRSKLSVSRVSLSLSQSISGLSRVYLGSKFEMMEEQESTGYRLSGLNKRFPRVSILLRAIHIAAPPRACPAKYRREHSRAE